MRNQVIFCPLEPFAKFGSALGQPWVSPWERGRPARILVKALPRRQSAGEPTNPVKPIATTLPSLVRAGRPRSQGSQPFPAINPTYWRILQKAPLNRSFSALGGNLFCLPDLWRIPLELSPTPSWPFVVLSGPSWIPFFAFVDNPQLFQISPERPFLDPVAGIWMFREVPTGLLSPSRAGGALDGKGPAIPPLQRFERWVKTLPTLMQLTRALNGCHDGVQRQCPAVEPHGLNAVVPKEG